MAYPTTKVTFTDPSGTSTQDNPDHAGLHTDINNTVESLEDTVGTTAGTNVFKNFAAGDFPVRINAGGTLQQVFNGTANVMAGTINSSLIGTLNNTVLGTPSITGGTLGAAVVGTSSIVGGTITTALITSSTINAAVIGTPSLTGGTLNKPVINAYYDTPITITPGAGSTGTLDLALANEHKVTMPAGNITLAVANASTGQKFLVEVTQDGTGSRTVTWFTTIRWVNATAPTLTTTASKRDTLGFIVTGAATYDGFIVGQNI